VIGDGAAVHIQGFQPLNQVRDAACAVQQAVFGVQVQVGSADDDYFDEATANDDFDPEQWRNM